MTACVSSKPPVALPEVKTELIVALDLPSAQAALDLVRQLDELAQNYKVGKELFVAEGPAVVRALRERGANVFVDLKFHDIPNTVARASAAVAKLGARWFTVHASGGSEMIRAAREAVSRVAKSEEARPRLLAVTVLTSLDDMGLKEIGVDHTATGQALHLSRLAKASGADGVIASVNEAQLIREEIGNDFLIVTPGIRPAATRPQDQKRTATPRQAVQAGATHIVVGRPITAAADPRAAAQAVIEELAAD